MFIQVMRGKVKDAAAVRAASEEWEAKLKSGATGYLGTTEGVAKDGTFVAIVRFESEEAAKANSDRPEQGAWWEETSKLFEGDVTFYDCPRVETFQGGGSDDAGFVQVMVYKPGDVDAVLEMSKEFEKISPMRPDILGGTTAVASDGTMIDTNYFTTEAEARAGESQMMTPEVQQIMDRFGQLAGPVEFIDLSDPRMSSA
jgi:hypothetical protein